MVFVVSFRGHISKELARSADQYIPLTELAGVIQKNHPAFAGKKAVLRLLKYYTKVNTFCQIKDPTCKQAG